ncbi:MAG: hypothetical protein VCE91_04965 [Nitrospinota bacterium]
MTTIVGVNNAWLATSMPHLLLQHLAHQALSANDDLSALILVLQGIGIYAHGGRLIMYFLCRAQQWRVLPERVCGKVYFLIGYNAA